MSHPLVASITVADVKRLRQFHLDHFPNQPVPDTQPSAQELQPDPEVDLEDLGYYKDGVRRTLTDEQIAMFRHSEIQRLLAQRRRQNELEERRQKDRQADLKRKKPPYVDANISRYHDDNMIHAQNTVAELTYDDTPKQKELGPMKVKQFLWPTLGL